MSGRISLARLSRQRLFAATLMLASLPAQAEQKKSAEELADLKVAKKPAYQVTCRGSGEIRKAPPVEDLNPPTAAQLAALKLLEAEAQDYTASAKDFQGRLTTIVRHHYEERRRRVLSAIDKEIDLQKGRLADARDEAIRRLEVFIARYSGENADPEATPDAMLRLAALYEERARTDFEADLLEELKPAIALYRDILVEYPAYSEASAALYYLGHALLDSGRLEESQQSWRALVCANRYQVKAVSEDSSEIFVQPLPQDHDDRFWNDWYNKNPLPLDEAGQRPDLTQAGVAEEELVFKDPYEGCEPTPQEVLPGQEPRYLAEIWWQLGNHHFDQIDPKGGPYNLNRAVSAYDYSLKYKNPPLYGVAMYKQAWAYFKQQRYEEAIRFFVQLLYYADEQERLTGDPGADFRAEAFTYIAGSLTYVDLKGPPPQDPFIPRNDVLDTELDPLVAEEKMAIAIERLQDPAIIPQDQGWTVGIYKALAREFSEISQKQNAIRAMELTVQKFPMDRDAPVMMNRVAEIYDELSRLAPQGSETRTEYAQKALAARTKLADYVGNTAWTDANRADPEALAQAEELARVGLQRAAADHTNYARAYKEAAFNLSDAKAQTDLLNRSIDEYRLAALGWGAYIDQNPTATDIYESSFWLADARFWVAVLQVPLGRMPTEEEIAGAHQAASAVRDSNQNDKYKQPAAYFVVTLAEKVLDGQARIFEESGGKQGIERKTQVSFVEADGKKTVKKEEVPPEVQAAVCARDEYNAAISLEEDPEKNGLLYATSAAEYFFVYGQFAEARRRFLPIYEEYCGKNKWGYNAWEKLISMSNFENDAKQSKMLVESRSCAFDEETRVSEEAIRAPVKITVAYEEAGKLFQKAMKMEDGPERDKTWRRAAGAYKVALDVAPERDEAPEAVMNGAYAYKQVGEYDKAIAMYDLFIKKYGDSATMARLKTEEPAKFEERVKYLGDAYQALAGAYVLFFDYPKAAETFDDISAVEHFSVEERRTAAKQGLMLYVNLDDKKGMEAMRKRYQSLGASAEEMAEADFLIASAVVKKWDPNSPDKGANQQARIGAMNAMTAYHDANKGRPAAARYVVHASYKVAEAKRASKSPAEDEWWKKTIEAFDKYAASAPKKGGKSEAIGSVEASMAAEGEYLLIDRQLKKEFDYDTGHHRYKGTVVEVVNQYGADAKDAKAWYDKLQKVVDKYVSQKWATVAIARQGSVYDSLRTGLFNTRPPELKMFTAQQEKALKTAEESDNMDLIDKADEIRSQVRDAWTKKRDQELDSADRIVVDRYAVSVMLAQRYNLSHESITRSIRRLAFLTDVTGEAKMAEYTSGNKELKYEPGMFQRMRPGVTEAPKVGELPAPSVPGGGE